MEKFTYMCSKCGCNEYKIDMELVEDIDEVSETGVFYQVCKNCSNRKNMYCN